MHSYLCIPVCLVVCLATHVWQCGFVWNLVCVSFGADLLHAHLAHTDEAENAKVAVEKAGLVRKRIGEQHIGKGCQPIPKVADCINVVEVFANVGGVEPKLLLGHGRFDGSVLHHSSNLSALARCGTVASDSVWGRLITS